MKLTIEGTPDELKNVLQAICGSEEHEEIKMNVNIDPLSVKKILANTLKAKLH